MYYIISIYVYLKIKTNRTLKSKNSINIHTQCLVRKPETSPGFLSSSNL